MRRLVVLCIAIAGIAATSPAQAQQPAPRLELDVVARQPVPPVTPMPPPTVLERDADEAIAASQARRADEVLIREAVRPPSFRPDLQRDVMRGVQARTIERALRR